MKIIIFPLIFLSGVFFPVKSVPVWMEIISKINPVTYDVDAIRQIFLGPEIASIGGVTGEANPNGVTVFGHIMTMAQDVLVVIVIGVILMSLAILAFNKQD